MAKFTSWQGISGTAYLHDVYYPWDTLPICPANYVLLRRDGLEPVPLYFGHTNNLEARLRQHQREDPELCAEATELHAHFFGIDEEDRRSIESDLLSRHPTPWNELGSFEDAVEILAGVDFNQPGAR